MQQRYINCGRSAWNTGNVNPNLHQGLTQELLFFLHVSRKDQRTLHILWIHMANCALKQETIPVEFIPPTCWPVGRGAVLSGGRCCPRGWRYCPGGREVLSLGEGGAVLRVGVLSLGGGAVHNRKWHHSSSPPLPVNRQTGVKTLPSRNFVCGW